MDVVASYFSLHKPNGNGKKKKDFFSICLTNSTICSVTTFLGKVQASISNFFRFNLNCFQRYLAVDFQLFLITPLLVYPLWRWRRKFFWFLPTLVVLIMGCTFSTMYINKIPVWVDEQ